MTRQAQTPEVVRRGTPVVPGVGLGPVIRPSHEIDVVAAQGSPVADAEAELQRYTVAVDTVAGRLERRSRNATGVAAEVLIAQVGMVRDKGMLSTVKKAISGGANAETATVASAQKFIALFEKAGGLMAERTTDLWDLAIRVVAELQGLPEPGIATPDEPSVLVADDLAPADTAGLDASFVVAIALRLGGSTSHTAIIARQLGIPCVVAADVADLKVGELVLVDGGSGQIVRNPDRVAAQARVEADRVARDAAAKWSGPGQTADGMKVDIYANVQDGATARSSASGPAEGVGLFRSELAFLGRDTEPSVDDQAALYAEVLTAYAGRKVVIRTLDAGSDKPMKFATLPDEDNPALGVRGLRVSFDNPDLLVHQLDAIAQAADLTGTAPWVMAPMVATADEARSFAEQVRARGLTPGVMVEIPSAALRASQLLEYVDFLSIGTNDLSQYTMAADRLSSRLAALTDSWQPAVLQLIAMTAAAGRDHAKRVGVCGEAAADPLLACVLVGMGISSLSMAAPAIGHVGAAIAAVTSEQCARAARAALAGSDPASARQAAAAVLGR